jgi:hypothetical protein
MELNVMKYSDFKLKAVLEKNEPIVDGLINNEEFVLLHAAGKTGKSMLALNIGLAVATGRDVLGFETRISKVVYVQTELAYGSLKDRIEAMLIGTDESGYDLAAANFHIACDRIRIDKPGGIELLKKAVTDIAASLLIIDPLYDLHGKNEDSSTEMAPLLAEIRSIARDCSCAVLLIHHQGKRGEGYSSHAGHACRGSSSFADVPDSSISLTKDKGSFCLKAIFRNRPSIEGISLAFDDKTMMFTAIGESHKPQKTKDLVLNLITESPHPLSKKEIHEGLRSIGSNIQMSAVQKQLESLRDSGQLISTGAFKNTKFHVLNPEGGNSPS